MANHVEPGQFQQIILLVVDGVGVGAQRDAGRYGGRGADTLAHVAKYVGGLDVPLLQWMGLGNVASIPGIEPVSPPGASHGLMARVSSGVGAAEAVEEMTAGTLEGLVARGIHVIALGGIAQMTTATQATVRQETNVPEDVIDYMLDAVEMGNPGVVAGLVSPGARDELFGPVGLARTVERIDVQLGAVMDALEAHNLLIVTSAGGADPTLGAHGERTREYVPLLAYTPAAPSGIDLGRRQTLADIGATIAENFGLGARDTGESFYGALLS